MRAPNPRLQRTRSASPPSPLSRQPLGRTVIITLSVALLSLCLAACATTLPPRPDRQYLITQQLAICDDLSLYEVVCNSSLHEVLNLYPDGMATSEHEELRGKWRVLDQDAAFEVNGRHFRFEPAFKSYFSPYTPGASFGFHAVPLSSLDRWSSNYSGRFRDTNTVRSLLHYRLAVGVYVHDACIGLQEIGTMESVPYLIRGLPHRTPSPEPTAFIDTVSHCRDALVRITHQDLGWYADDWEIWWARQPRPDAP